MLPPLWLRALMVGWNSYMYTSPSGDSCGAASANARSSVVEWYRGRADRAAIHRKKTPSRRNPNLEGKIKTPAWRCVGREIVQEPQVGRSIDVLVIH